MLTIRVSKDHTTKPFINDAEAWFKADAPGISKMYLDKDSVRILQNIEGMTVRHRDWIEAKFGAVPLTNISTGAKVALLCNTLHDKYCINTDEVGYNVIKEIMHLAETKDIEIYAGRVLDYFPDDYQAIVEDELCIGDDITDAMEYLLDVED